MSLMMPMRFDEATGTMIPDPTVANTKREVARMLEWQKANGAAVKAKMPMLRKTKRAREKRAADKARVTLTGQRPLADIRAGREARARTRRQAAADAQTKADTQIDELSERELELEQRTRELAAERKARLELEHKLAALEKSRGNDSKAIADVLAELQSVKSSVAALQASAGAADVPPAPPPAPAATEQQHGKHKHK
jgi:hypothetical protein